MNGEECCETCRYWLKVAEPLDVNQDMGTYYSMAPKPATGACRRRPPVVLVVANATPTRFPSTSADQWYGEWSSRDVGGPMP